MWPFAVVFIGLLCILAPSTHSQGMHFLLSFWRCTRLYTDSIVISSQSFFFVDLLLTYTDIANSAIYSPNKKSLWSTYANIVRVSPDISLLNSINIQYLMLSSQTHTRTKLNLARKKSCLCRIILFRLIKINFLHYSGFYSSAPGEKWLINTDVDVIRTTVRTWSRPDGGNESFTYDVTTVSVKVS